LFSNHVIAAYYSADRASISPCGRDLIDAVLASDRPVTLDWVATSARTYERRRIEAERRAQREAERRAEREARAARATAAYERAAASVSGSSRGSTSNPGDPGGSRIRELGGLAVRQAQGIAGGNLSIYDTR